jgi:hypothetical protein
MRILRDRRRDEIFRPRDQNFNKPFSDSSAQSGGSVACNIELRIAWRHTQTRSRITALSKHRTTMRCNTGAVT